VEDCSDEPSKIAVGVPASDGLLVPSEECVDELGTTRSSVELGEHKGRDDDVLAGPRRSLHGLAHTPFGLRVRTCQSRECVAVKGDDQRPPSARS
jgi:hypothetical protein